MTTPPTASKPPPDENKGFQQTVSDFKEKWSSIYPIVIYVSLVIGLLMLFLSPFIGGLIIGFITGLTFTREIFEDFMRTKEAIEHSDVTRGVILGVLCLAIFIVAPGIVIGAALAVGLKKILELTERTPEAGSSIKPPAPSRPETIKVEPIKVEPVKTEPPPKK